MASVTTKLVGALIVGLLLGSGATYAYITSTTPVKPPEPQLITYTLGVALPFSGPLANFGKSFEKAVLLAVEQINGMLENSGSKIRFATVSADTETSPAGALKAVTTLVEGNNVQLIIGPLSTGEVMGAKQYVDQRKIVILAPASTAPAAAIPGDFIFRLVDPPDTFQGQALAKLISAQGYTKTIVLFRDDPFGNGLSEIFTARYREAGGQTVLVKYAPDQADYAAEVSRVSQEVASTPTDVNVAVLLIAFEGDAQKIFQRGMTDASLKRPRWYGVENLKSPNFLPPKASAELGQFLADVKFTVTSAFFPGNPNTPSFPAAYTAKYGEDPLPFADDAYDVTYVAAWTILIAGKYEGETLRKLVPEVAKRFVGVTVQTYLDANGDQAIAYFGLFTVEVTAGNYQFTRIGSYDGSTGNVSLGG